jgi:hypothetical protein
MSDIATQTSVSANVHFYADGAITVKRQAESGTIAVTLGDWPAHVNVFFDDDAAYLTFYAAMSAFFTAENNAIAKVL